MFVLCISAYYHDSAAAFIFDGKVTAAICEERLSRIKHDKSFPKRAIAFCVEYSGITYTDIDYVVFYEKPLRKFERILTTHILNGIYVSLSIICRTLQWHISHRHLKMQLF